MPLRSQGKIRRDINRLDELIQEHASVHAPFKAIKAKVSASATDVNTKWQAYQGAALTSSKEIKERNEAVVKLARWVRSWRGVVLIMVPGARENIRELPSRGATADDLVRLATDLSALITARPEAAEFREDATAELGTQIEDTRREAKEASVAVPAKQAARAAYSQSTLEANVLLVQGSEIVRTVFGAKSGEYKQFVARASAAEEEEDDRDADTGEDDDDDVIVVDTGDTDDAGS